MKIVFKTLFYIFIFLINYSCYTKTEDKSKLSDTLSKIEGIPMPCEESDFPINIASGTDTLKIIIQASDCGEWGGHKESIYLQRNIDDKLYARYILDTVPCGFIVEKDGFGVLDDKRRVIILDTIKYLTKEDEKLISVFIQRLVELYLKHELGSNAGTIYEVSYTDLTMKFTYWNSGDCRDTYYRKVREQLFGDILKKKNIKYKKICC